MSVQLDKGFRFNSLTSLRGIAAFCVVLSHLNVIWHDAFPSMSRWGYFMRFASHSYLFVDFFFILSGFVITHVYRDTFGKTVNFQNYFAFARTRFARLYPLHILVLSVYVILGSIGFKQEIPNPDGSLLAHLFLVHSVGLFDRLSWNIPSWSISVEWWVYSLFPFSALLFHHKFRATSAFLGVVIAVVGYSLIAISRNSLNVHYDIGLIRCLSGFSTGAFLYTVFVHLDGRFPKRQLRLLAFPAVIATFVFVPSPYADVLAVCEFCLIVLSTETRPSSRTWLNRPVLIWMGEISYSFYLWHTLALHLFGTIAVAIKERYPWRADQDFLFFAILLVAFELFLLVLSHFSYKVIEVPAKDFLTSKRLGTIKRSVASSGG